MRGYNYSYKYQVLIAANKAVMIRTVVHNSRDQHEKMATKFYTP